MSGTGHGVFPVPDHPLDRVNAAMRTVGRGMSAVGMAAGGVVSFGRRLTGLVRGHHV
ncbi:hypothetical protein ACWGSK_18035 [Nocardiopsis sp. NPDC055551]|uniref:hypothetical protein n=1 Tax=Nocardiopsis sp. NPDC006832 TaxID=3157188 RepID=UPI0033C12675